MTRNRIAARSWYTPILILLAGAIMACTLAAATPHVAVAADVDHPREMWFNPGLKASYTFGGQGWTFGVELSLTWFDPDVLDDMINYGIVFDADTNFSGFSKIRLGGEAFFLGLGLESGPSMIWADSASYFGWGLSVWGSTYAIPYYTYTNVFGREDNLHELGLYLKIHCSTSDGLSCGGSDDDDPDWD